MNKALDKELCLILKGLGFDYPTLSYYIISVVRDDKGELSYLDSDEVKKFSNGSRSVNYNAQPHLLLAPTPLEAEMWLIEKLGLFVKSSEMGDTSYVTIEVGDETHVLSVDASSSPIAFRVNAIKSMIKRLGSLN